MLLPFTEPWMGRAAALVFLALALLIMLAVRAQGGRSRRGARRVDGRWRR